MFTDIHIAMVNIKMHTLFAEIHASLRNYILAGVRKLWSNIIFFFILNDAFKNGVNMK